MAFSSKRKHIAIRWPAAFRKRKADDSLATAELWQRHFDGDAAAFQPLFDHYAPLCQIIAFSEFCRRRELYRSEPVEDLIGDGAIGLFAAIQNQSDKHFDAGDNPPHLFLWQACKNIRATIRKTIFRETLKRKGFSRRHAENQSIIQAERGKFVQANARMPDRHELIELLATKFDNPNIVLDYKKPVAATGCPDPAKATRALKNSPSRELSPDHRALTDESMRLALKGLKGVDRKAFRMMLRGECGAAIAAHLGIGRDTIHKRLRGLVWEARARADLAKHFDRDPIPAPVRVPSNRRRSITEASLFFARTGLCGGNIPPHVLAMGLKSVPTRKLDRLYRSDDEIRQLLRSGYSGAKILDATRGGTKPTRLRIKTIQRALLAELENSPATALAG